MIYRIKVQVETAHNVENAISIRVDLVILSATKEKFIGFFSGGNKGQLIKLL